VTEEHFVCNFTCTYAFEDVFAVIVVCSIPQVVA
jgi:hypothetical protein